MPRVAPAHPRSTQTAIPGGIRFVIPARRHWFLIPFLCVWLVGWGFGEVMVIRQVIRGDMPWFGVLLLLVWLAGWTAGGAFAATAVAWIASGREVVSVASGTLAVRREAFGIGRTREYDGSQVRNVRIAPTPFNPFDFKASFRFWGLGGGPVAFDYGARTLRFGAGIDEAEAAPIVAALRERLPSA